jgi:hypothetical protein
MGLYLSTETKDGNIFIGKEDLFKPQTEDVCLH